MNEFYKKERDKNQPSLICIITWSLIALIMCTSAWMYIKLISYFIQ